MTREFSKKQRTMGTDSNNIRALFKNKSSRGCSRKRKDLSFLGFPRKTEKSVICLSLLFQKSFSFITNLRRGYANRNASILIRFSVGEELPHFDLRCHFRAAKSDEDRTAQKQQGLHFVEDFEVKRNEQITKYRVKKETEGLRCSSQKLLEDSRKQ